jgi:hypothetical protein
VSYVPKPSLSVLSNPGSDPQPAQQGTCHHSCVWRTFQICHLDDCFCHFFIFLETPDTIFLYLAELDKKEKLKGSSGHGLRLILLLRAWFKRPTFLRLNFFILILNFLKKFKFFSAYSSEDGLFVPKPASFPTYRSPKMHFVFEGRFDVSQMVRKTAYETL